VPSNRNELKFAQQASPDMLDLCQPWTCGTSTEPRASAGRSSGTHRPSSTNSGPTGCADWARLRAKPYRGHAFQRAGLASSELSEAALNRLPVLEKATLRPSTEEMLTEPASGLFPMNTSGSTGVPLQVLRNQRDQAEVSALLGPLLCRLRPPDLRPSGQCRVRASSSKKRTGGEAPARCRTLAARAFGVRSRFVERLGDAFEYDGVCVDDRPVAPSGKFQTIIPLEEPLAPPTA
jgi:hypothetical protein